MEKETKQMLIVCGTIITVFLVLLGCVYAYSGVNPPFSTVNSSSMQHSDESTIGTIDTGDMVIVKDPEDYDITTYVEGAKKDYSKFGEYGDVIIYRTSTNNIIHRAMLKVTLEDIEIDEINPAVTKSQKWYIPSLIDYEDWDLFKMSGTTKHSVKNDGTIWNEDLGMLTLAAEHKEVYLELNNVGYSDATIFIKLWYIGTDHGAGYSGYLTKGDNAETNASFDQNILSQVRNELVTEDMIKSVAAVEIPWLGCIKLYVNGTNTDQIPTNSVINLVIIFVAIIAFAFLLNFLLTRKKSE